MPHTVRNNGLFCVGGSASSTVTIDYRPVHEYTMTNEIAYIEPKARVY